MTMRQGTENRQTERDTERDRQKHINRETERQRDWEKKNLYKDKLRQIAIQKQKENRDIELKN